MRGLLLVLATLAISFGQSIAHSKSNVVIGSTCVTIDTTIVVEGNSTGSATLECPNTDPAKSFRVRYIWLDAFHTQLLLNGYNKGYIADLFGPQYVLLKNDVYHRLSKILSSYSYPISESEVADALNYAGGDQSNLSLPTRSLRIIGRKSEAAEGSLRFTKSELERLKFYEGDDLFIWPDVRATKDVVETTVWPSNYYQSYSQYDVVGGYEGAVNSDIPADQRNPIACTFLYDFVTKPEFDGYQQELDTAAAEILRRKSEFGFVRSSYIDVYGLNFDQQRKSLTQYNALRYFSRNQWPSDFLLKFGSYLQAGCGDAEFGFYAQPRRLLSLVAVVQSMQGSFELEGVQYAVSASAGLSAGLDFSDTREEMFGTMQFKRNESLIIPLRIELRYDLNSFPLAPTQENVSSRELYDMTMVSQPDLIVEDNGVLSKSKKNFSPPSFVKVNDTYYFGTSLQLNGIYIGETLYETRKAPRTALLSYQGLDGASCPFFHAIDEKGALIEKRRVLVNARSSNAKHLEVIRLPTNTRSVEIVELEPEVTFIEWIEVQHPANFHSRVIARNLTILPGQSVVSVIGKDIPSSWLMAIYGHYETLTTLSSR